MPYPDGIDHANSRREWDSRLRLNWTVSSLVSLSVCHPIIGQGTFTPFPRQGDKDAKPPGTARVLRAGAQLDIVEPRSISSTVSVMGGKERASVCDTMP